MSFVDSLHPNKKLDYVPDAMSHALLAEHGEAIARIDAALKASGPADMVAVLNSAIAWEVTFAKEPFCLAPHADRAMKERGRGFASLDDMLERGLGQLPETDKNTAELLYRIMLYGALMQFANEHPIYRKEAGRKRLEHENGISDAYRRVMGGDKETALEYTLDVSAAIEAGNCPSR